MKGENKHYLKTYVSKFMAYLLLWNMFWHSKTSFRGALGHINIHPPNITWLTNYKSVLSDFNMSLFDLVHICT